MIPNEGVATLVPLAHLDLIEQNNYFLALANVCHRSEYIKFFRDRSREHKFVILDNAAVENGHPGDFKNYFDIALEMEASEIMLPDVFMEPMATFEAAQDALNWSASRILLRNLDVMIIPQGRNFEEWTQNAADLHNLVLKRGLNPTIGISCRYTDFFYGSRALGVLLVHHFPYTKIHLLGAYANPFHEARPLLTVPRVRGIDSSYPSVYASHGMHLRDADFFEPRPSRKINFENDV